MNGAQVSAFQANSGIAPSAMATVLVGVVFAVLLVWGVWAIRTAYVGWSESRLNQRQFLGVCIRFVAMYLVLTSSSSPDLKGLTMQNRILTSRFVPARRRGPGAAALPCAVVRARVCPQLENPTRGAGNGIMETIRNYGYDIIMLVALLVVASMFIGVCYHAYGHLRGNPHRPQDLGPVRPHGRHRRRPARDRHLAAHRSHRHPVRRGRYVRAAARPCGRDGHVPSAPAQPPSSGRARPHRRRAVDLLRPVRRRRPSWSARRCPVFRTIAIAPTFVVLGVALGVFIGGGILRRPQARPSRHLAVPATAVAHRHAPSAGGRLGRAATC